MRTAIAGPTAACTWIRATTSKQSAGCFLDFVGVFHTYDAPPCCTRIPPTVHAIELAATHGFVERYLSRHGCCTANCKVNKRMGYQCSPQNQIKNSCCGLDCQFKVPGHQCQVCAARGIKLYCQATNDCAAESVCSLTLAPLVARPPCHAWTRSPTTARSSPSARGPRPSARRTSGARAWKGR